MNRKMIDKCICHLSPLILHSIFSLFLFQHAENIHHNPLLQKVVNPPHLFYTFLFMLRNQAIKQAEEWISLSGSPSPPSISEIDVKRDPDYSFYPYPIIYPDMLPPDYPAIISLLFSVIAICFNVQHFLELYIQWRQATWLGAVFLFGSFADMKFYEIDYTQVIVSSLYFTFLLFNCQISTFVFFPYIGVL